MLKAGDVGVSHGSGNGYAVGFPKLPSQYKALHNPPSYPVTLSNGLLRLQEETQRQAELEELRLS